eukprot:TRINITY_DN25386_c0_g1_i1.p1 TRINITY_DN25386_c0_g1~~TRINITY_DN25386_c0_g1_i1.p1  ORF type:complete len:377 (+),score=89.10 TRINITY_DN25386_c0_g1_i1:60-1190(+)
MAAPAPIATNSNGRKRRDPPVHDDTWPEDGKRWICFVRHAQALHNVYDDNLWTPDNPLTDVGEKSCKSAREEWGRAIFDGAELVVVSPMTRALQTAYFLNGGEAGSKWLVTPMCAERLSGATCDEGTPKTQQLQALPWMRSLNGVDDLDEMWWTLPREEEELRVAAFLNFLSARPERRIVVVSHGAFLEYIVGFHLHNVQHHIMSLEDCKTVKSKMCRSSLNLNLALVKEYETEPLRSIVQAPLTCFQGLGRKKAALLAQAGGPRTVRALATWRFARWADAIRILAPTEQEGARDMSKTKSQLNINKALDAEWEGYSFNDILEAPVSALEGLSELQAKSLRSIGIRTIKDLASWKYYQWSKAISDLAETETPDGSS